MSERKKSPSPPTVNSSPTCDVPEPPSGMDPTDSLEQNSSSAVATQQDTTSEDTSFFSKTWLKRIRFFPDEPQNMTSKQKKRFRWKQRKRRRLDAQGALSLEISSSPPVSRLVVDPNFLESKPPPQQEETLLQLPRVFYH